MIRNYQVQQKQRNLRFSQKTLDGTFLNLIEQGANCPPFVSNAILNTAKKVYRLTEANPEGVLRQGQMKIVGVADHEPAGKSILECQKRECVVTLYADSEDDQIRALYGTTGLRRHKLLRIATEALEQGVLLTQEDFAYRIFNCGLRTVARDIKYFKEQGVIVPTRGQQMDIGPGVSHKVLAIEYLLQRKDEHKIAQIIYHSLTAVERYTIAFARVVLLKQKQISVDEIAFVVQLSKRMVKSYLALYEKYKDNPDYRDRLDEIIGKGRNFDSLFESAHSGADDAKKNRKEPNQ